MKKYITLLFGVVIPTLFLNALNVQEETVPVRLNMILNQQDEVLLLNPKINQVVLSKDLKKLNAYQNTSTGWIARAQTKNKKWGYLDSQGKWLFAPTFDKVKTFSSDNIARVQKNKKWGFLKTDGSFLIEPKFYNVTPFSSGFAAVQEKNGDNYYFINVKGERAFSKEFCGARFFSSTGYAAVAVCPKIPVYEVGPEGVEVTQKNGKESWGYIGKDGKMLIKPRFKCATTFNQFKVASICDESGSKRLIDDKGKFIVETQFEYLWGYSNSGVAWSESKGEKKFKGYIDTKGKAVWEASYHDFGGEHNGLLVNHRNGYQVYDPFGKIVIKEKSSWADNFQDANATVALRNNTWGILNRDGTFKTFPNNILSPLTYDYEFVVGFVDGLVPMLSKSRDIIYFDRKAEVKYQLLSDEKGFMVLFDKEKKALWHSGVQKRNIKSLLSPGAQDHFTDVEDYGDGIIKSIKKLLVRKPQKYFIPNPIYRSESSDPYDLSGDIDVLKKGAIKIVCSSYVSETMWAKYYYLDTLISDKFDDYKAKIKESIIKKYGKPFLSKYSKDKWKIEDKILTMRSLSDSGDGDFYNQIILEVEAEEKK